MGNAYVLMRVYNPVVKGMDSINEFLNFDMTEGLNDAGPLERLFLDRLERAIVSVKANNCNLIVCDDTPDKNPLLLNHRRMLSEMNGLKCW